MRQVPSWRFPIWFGACTAVEAQRRLGTFALDNRQLGDLTKVLASNYTFVLKNYVTPINMSHICRVSAFDVQPTDGRDFDRKSDQKHVILRTKERIKLGRYGAHSALCEQADHGYVKVGVTERLSDSEMGQIISGQAKTLFRNTYYYYILNYYSFLHDIFLKRAYALMSDKQGFCRRTQHSPSATGSSVPEQ